MSLESELEQEDNSCTIDNKNHKSSPLKTLLETTACLVGGAAGATISYNVAGAFATASKFTDKTDVYITAGLLTYGAIKGYKVVSKLIKNTKKKIKRNFARAKILKEISQDDEFLGRQGIKKGKFGPIRSILKYLLTVPAGGALGYFPGAVGVNPLCIYFGGVYAWEDAGTLDSGAIAGSAIGAYAFTEMSFKKQYEKMLTTAFALGGITGCSHATDGLDIEIELWPWLGLNALSAILTGSLGNLAYNSAKKPILKINKFLSDYKIQIIKKEKASEEDIQKTS